MQSFDGVWKIAGQEMEAQTKNFWKKNGYTCIFLFLSSENFSLVCLKSKIITFEKLKEVNIAINTESDP